MHLVLPYETTTWDKASVLATVAAVALALAVAIWSDVTRRRSEQNRFAIEQLVDLGRYVADRGLELRRDDPRVRQVLYLLEPEELPTLRMSAGQARTADDDALVAALMKRLEGQVEAQVDITSPDSILNQVQEEIAAAVKRRLRH